MEKKTFQAFCQFFPFVYCSGCKQANKKFPSVTSHEKTSLPGSLLSDLLAQKLIYINTKAEHSDEEWNRESLRYKNTLSDYLNT